MKIKRSSIVVHGSGPFPLDMLRYDSCFPDRPEDVTNIDYSIDPRTRMETPIEICISKFTISHNVWTPARWRSFGWEIVSVDGVPVKKKVKQ